MHSMRMIKKNLSIDVMLHVCMRCLIITKVSNYKGPYDSGIYALIRDPDIFM